MKKCILFILAIAVILFSCNDDQQGYDTETQNPPPPSIPFTILNSYPHDVESFTQGFTIFNGHLYESTGQYGFSWFGPVDLTTGKIDKKITLADNFFGEGHTFFRDKLYLITWREKKGFVYDSKTFKKLGEFDLLTEGWGLTHDSTYLILSDGSSNIFYLHPDSLNVVKTLSVTDNTGPVPNINELEYINGYIYANQWQTRYILKINPQTGKVEGRLDFRDVINNVKAKDPQFDAQEKTLNGIAWDPEKNVAYITGKYWPEILEIRFNP
jgi:glutamine cyclotransferase